MHHPTRQQMPSSKPRKPRLSLSCFSCLLRAFRGSINLPPRSHSPSSRSHLLPLAIQRTTPLDSRCHQANRESPDCPFRAFRVTFVPFVVQSAQNRTTPLDLIYRHANRKSHHHPFRALRDSLHAFRGSIRPSFALPASLLPIPTDACILFAAPHQRKPKPPSGPRAGPIRGNS